MTCPLTSRGVRIAGASPYMRSLLKSLGEKDEEEVLAHLARAASCLHVGD